MSTFSVLGKPPLNGPPPPPPTTNDDSASSLTSTLGSALRSEAFHPHPHSFALNHNVHSHSHSHSHSQKRGSSFASQSPSLGPQHPLSHSFRRAKNLLDNMARSFTSQTSNQPSPAFGPNTNTSQLAMSLSRSLGKSWTREAFLDTLAMHLDPKSPFMAPSPSRDLDQFAMLEDKFCKDFNCCGITLDSMHELLQHYEEYHVRVESDYGDDDLDFDSDDEDDEHFPFGIDSMEDDDMDMDEFDVVSAQQQQEFNTAFLRAQIAAMATNTPTQHTVSGFANPQFQPQQPLVRATISSMLGSTASQPLAGNPFTFSQIQKHDNNVDDFRIMRTQSDIAPPTENSAFSAFNDTVIRQKRNNTTTNASGSVFGSSVSPQQKPSSSSVSPTTLPTPTQNTSATNPQQRRRKIHATTQLDVPSLLPFSETTAILVQEDSDAEDEVYLLQPQPHHILHQNLHIPTPTDDLTEVLVEEGPSVPAPTPVPSTATEDRPFKCKVEGCGKEYKNPNGLKYHMRNSHIEDTGDPEMNEVIQKPYQCVVGECGKRYKNLNGLKYHIQHAHSELLQGAAEEGEELE